MNLTCCFPVIPYRPMIFLTSSLSLSSGNFFIMYSMGLEKGIFKYLFTFLIKKFGKALT